MNNEIDMEDIAPWLVLFITIIAIFIRMVLLVDKGMWLDETFSVWMANHRIVDMLHWIVRIDQHPPLYYLLLHYWIGLNGTGAYEVRLLSVIFGAATIPMVYLIGKRMANDLVGLMAALILAFSPFNIYYAQETRMYTLLMFNASVAIYALVRLLTDPRSNRPIGSQFRNYVRAWRTPVSADSTARDIFSPVEDPGKQSKWRAWVLRHHWLPIHEISTDLTWIVFILFAALTLYTHNTAVLFIVAINLFVLGLLVYHKIKKSAAQTAFQAPSFWSWVTAQIVILILWLPWLVTFIKQASTVYRRFWIPQPTWTDITQVLKSFLNASGPIPPELARILWIFFGLLLCLGLFSFRKKISQFLFLACLFVIPFVGELLVSIWRPIFLDRTLIWTTIPLFVLLAAGIAQCKARIVVFLVLGMVVTINLFSISDYFKWFQKEDWDTAARDVGGFAQQGDLVLFNSNFVEVPCNYYFETFETHHYLHVEKRGLPQDLFDSGILEPVMTTKDVPSLISLVKGRDRVWLVYSHNSYTDPSGLIPQTLAKQMNLSWEDDFYGGEVQLYVAP